MTTTISLNYDSVTFKSVNIIPTTTWGFDLTIRKNCGLPIIINLDSYSTSITNNSITVSSNDLFGTVVLPDGVYNFSLACYNTTDTDSFTYNEQTCTYIGTTTRCKTLELYQTTKDENLKCKLEIILFALENAYLCDTCTCSKMCNLYNELLLLINSPINTTVTNVYSDCGC